MKCPFNGSVTDWHPSQYGAMATAPSSGTWPLRTHNVLVTYGARLSLKNTAKIIYGVNYREETPKENFKLVKT